MDRWYETLTAILAFRMIWCCMKRCASVAVDGNEDNAGVSFLNAMRGGFRLAD
jgi:hypothetical protein